MFFVCRCPRNTISSIVFGFSPVPGSEDHLNSSLCWRTEQVLTTFFVSTGHQHPAAFPCRGKIAIQPKFTGHLLHARDMAGRQGQPYKGDKTFYGYCMGMCAPCQVISEQRGSGWPRAPGLAFWKWCSRPVTSKDEPASELSTWKVRDLLLMTLPLLRQMSPGGEGGKCVSTPAG